MKLLKIQGPQPSNLGNAFVHRNAWYSICDFVYTDRGDQWVPPLDRTTPCNPESIPQNSVIFITPFGIEEFLEQVHPKIKNQYILVTYCYGPVFKYSSTITDGKILHWFGQANSNAITFDNFTLMPLGLLARNDIFDDRVENMKALERIKTNSKDKLLYMNMTVHQDKDHPQNGASNGAAGRFPVYHRFINEPYCTAVTLTPDSRKPFLDYMSEMSAFKFTISPLGDMADCYRHWEAIMVGSIPIIYHSPLDGIFSDLPVVLVDDYSEITEEFLVKRYDEMKDKKYNLDKLYMQYWINLINNCKAK